MNEDIFDQLIVDNQTKRRRKPKCYADVCNYGQARAGDVVYMPSHPDVLMTVKTIHHYNRAANHSPQRVTVQWLDANLHPVSAEMDAATLLLKV